jgi:glycosyltransferase involved in cell wall biosynthesis
VEMERASIYVLSSRFEGLPLVLLEAMSKGMAVVSFDCPTGPGEVVDDYRNGILVPARDVEALSAGMLELVDDEELRRRCAAAAVETARGFTMDQVGPMWEALLRDLWEERAASCG